MYYPFMFNEVPARDELVPEASAFRLPASDNL